MLTLFLTFVFCDDLQTKIQKLSLPTWSKGYQDISNTSEITKEEIEKAYQTFSYPLNPNSHVIISSRFSTIEEQFNHFIFGAAIAYALNRSIKLEMRNYPLTKKQPEFLLKFKEIKPKLYETDNFFRLRVAREIFCKNETYFLTDSPSIPILIRNYDDITTLYGNHFIGSRLRSLFGMHAVYFLAHHFFEINPPQKSSSNDNQKYIIGIEARVFDHVHRMKTMKDPKSVGKNFTNVINNHVIDKKSRFVLFTNNHDTSKILRKSLTNVQECKNPHECFSELVNANVFIGTYRSKYAQIINMARGVPGLLVNTNTGDVINMSNSQAGVLQPYLQDVEDAEYTVNEKLRGCLDNIEELREILEIFVL
ncbi:hypothetical protein TRFO_22900 [Tritrichomonas foetus]|uniref:Uncharacterized protein n=1 Tax=Tritrichomonas foetus TaxID=1144522 RepID=A0A1J4KGV1_9EUKA|nr:hypothetical protein TRFO_22900 [Tritrichomonas foetus]|eukprot:OHT08557.1 hypothetical protein TRFO_22900 [Tritrichomonas foetus]